MDDLVGFTDDKIEISLAVLDENNKPKYETKIIESSIDNFVYNKGWLS